MAAPPTFRLALLGAEIKPIPKKDDRAKALEKNEREIMKCTKRVIAKSPEQVEEERQAAEQLAQECELRRRESMHDGEEFLRDFLCCHFGEYLDHIRITSGLTLEEIRMIGNEEEQLWGVRQCRRLFNAPVLSDRIGHLLWHELRQGHALDHTHKRRTEDDGEGDELPAEEAENRWIRETEIRRTDSSTLDDPSRGMASHQMQRACEGEHQDGRRLNADKATSSGEQQNAPPMSPNSAPCLAQSSEVSPAPQTGRTHSAPAEMPADKGKGPTSHERQSEAGVHRRWVHRSASREWVQLLRRVARSW